MTGTGPERILVVGAGGREHALAWRLARDPGVARVIVTPGNPGMRDVGTLVGAGDPVALAQAEGVDLAVIGPEAPLADGLADRFAAAGIAVFGPGAAGAAMEASKAFCREVASAAGVPVAEGAAFELDEAAATDFARRLGGRVVVKVDGLAAGKGVTVCETFDEAEAAIRTARPRFGAAAARIVIERAVTGREASVIALTDGTTALAIPPARDHKRLRDGDAGPNTGGMGAYSPLEDLTDAGAATLVERIHRPLLGELARRGIRYSGALYAGLMLTDDGPVLLETNVRFGDPEAQVVLPRLEAPLAPLLAAAAGGRLARAAMEAGLADGRIPAGEAAVGVVLASEGYPEAPSVRRRIAVDAGRIGDALVFWSGVREDPEGLLTSGGRVATVVGRGATVAAAAVMAYEAADGIRFDGRHVRGDIARAPVATS
jgi:phosphoribosylamine---glycine ligase